MTIIVIVIVDPPAAHFYATQKPTSKNVKLLDTKNIIFYRFPTPKPINLNHQPNVNDYYPYYIWGPS